MRRKASQLRLPAVALALAAALLVAVAPAAATRRHHHHHSHHNRSRAHAVYVSPTGSASQHGNSCRHAGFNSIQAAIEAAPLKGTVVVCHGTYPGMVTVDRRVTLLGEKGATIDATGDVYGVGVSASYSTVTGLTVKNASPLKPPTQYADGIVTIGIGPSGPVAADHVRIIKNVVTGNLGSGIDLNSTSHSVAIGNKANGNGVGINVADDLNLPTSHNRVAFNITNGNFGGCGIALADHSGAGVTDNLVDHNVSNDNGLSTPTAPDASAGSGVILASAIPSGGVVTGNTITHNLLKGNGHGGVVVHAHVPGANFSGNVVSFNLIGTNNLRTDENDTQTTGIYLGSASPLTITVKRNVIHDDYYGIFTSGPVTVTGGKNQFRNVMQEVGSAPSF